MTNPMRVANRRSAIATSILVSILCGFGMASSVGVASSPPPGSSPSMAPLTGVTALAAGGEHTCALVDGGRVRCWGGRWEGDLGDDTRTDSQVPLEVVGVTGATSISAGSYHSCALVADGHVDCWGDNNYGQLGNGQQDVRSLREPPASDEIVPTASEVVGIDEATAVAVGGMHSCAIVAGGRVACWGANHGGALGDGTTEHSPLPIDVSGLGGATAIAAASSATCAIVAGGHIRCWGSGYSGLDDDVPTTGPAWVEVPGIVGATALSMGDTSACALVEHGVVRCWGSNEFGQLGDGRMSLEASPTPVDVVELRGAVALTSGWYHVCVITDDSGVSCWGSHEWHQLGVTIAGPSAVPVAVPGLFHATVLAAGDRHTCALIGSGEVRCWGADDRGQLGDGLAFSATPVDVSDLDEASQVAAGYGHACALVAGGRVRCWGSNEHGQLGDGTIIESSVPVDVLGLEDSLALTAGGDHTCALVADGHVSCWGRTGRGPTDADPRGAALDSLVPFQVPGLAGVTAISAGGAHTCARLADRRLTCWGANGSGQLGDGTTTASLVPVDVVVVSEVTAFAAGGEYTCAIVDAGAVRCWGSNQLGQLGNGRESDDPLPTGVEVLDVDDATSVATGFYQTCAIVAEAAVRCWGVANPVSHAGPELVAASDIPGIDGATRLSANFGRTCAVIRDGRVVCWGSNMSGMLGDGSTMDSTVPVAVIGLDRAVDLAVGGSHACALLQDSGVRCWGSNDSGQLGDGSHAPGPVTVVAGASGVAPVEADGDAGPSDGAATRIPPDRGAFTPTGSMREGRELPTATLLVDGRVLVVGGYGGVMSGEGQFPHGTDGLATAELWDPAISAFQPAGTMVRARQGHSATLLLDGRVLVVGGDGPDGPGPSAEIWDPASRTFTPTGSPGVARLGARATLLPYGRVLVVGGDDAEGDTIESAEVWDPTTGTFSPGDQLPEATSPEGTLLDDGTVLLLTEVLTTDAAGTRTRAPESVALWDPVSGRSSPAGSLQVAHGGEAVATRLLDGRVLISGGDDCPAARGLCTPIATAEIWDPVTMSSALTGPLGRTRWSHVAVLLLDGRVLVVGDGLGGRSNSAEVFALE